MYAPCLYGAVDIHTEKHHHYTGRVRSLQAQEYMMITSIFRELYIHRHSCFCATNLDKENVHSGV
jgi:hypothetical protein